MPRKKSKQPQLKPHISGQGRVCLDGKYFYCGEFGTPECTARYAALVSEYQRNGCRAPDQPTHLKRTAITIRMLTQEFRNTGLDAIRDAAHNSKFSWLCDRLDDEHGDYPAEQFGPVLLERFRQGLVDEGNRSRGYINSLIRFVQRIFTHGVRREILHQGPFRDLNSVPPLKTGEAEDNPPREPVPIKLVEWTLPFLAPVVRDMVKLQVATGCRPSELFSLTPSEVDRSDPDAWIIRKKHHKTASKGKRRSIPVVGEARLVLAEYLDDAPDELCFVNRVGNPWNQNSYRQHIQKKCKANKLTQWSPYQLRHLAGQAVRDNLTVEHVSALLGHARVDMAEVYSRAAEAKAIEAAKAIQK